MIKFSYLEGKLFAFQIKYFVSPRGKVIIVSDVMLL